MNLAKRLTVPIFTFLISLQTFSQATLYSDNFESPGTWLQDGAPNPNGWILGTCAGNGASEAGTNALYISKGGAIPGCGATGTEQYAYENSPAGIEQITMYTLVDGSCADNLLANFDYQIEDIPGEDFLELVYSTDGGFTFIPVGSALPLQSVWNSISIVLPALLDNSIFHIGFRFTYNNATINGIPPAIDNFSVVGDDSTPPMITCPAALDLVVDVNCDAIIGDYLGSKLALSDNCTDSALILVTQSIPEFTVLVGGPGDTQAMTLFAEDEAGNIGQCTFTLNIIDITPPSITCPGDTNIYVDLNCEGVLGDYIGTPVVSDNCSLTANIVITQDPLPGLLISGIVVETIVELTALDEDGNSASCTFVARTIDTIPASISCPADTVVYANSVCQGNLADYTSNAVVFDNCSALGSLTVSQSPVIGSVISGNQVITLTVTGGVPNNPQSCTFNAILIDTLAPGIICPVPNALYSNSNCEALLPNYVNSVIISENCDPSSLVVQNPPAGTLLTAPGSTTVTLTITDDSGNSGSCQFSPIVLDTISPQFTCPTNQTETGDAACAALLDDYTSLVSPTDNCSSVFTIVQDPPAGTSFSSPLIVEIQVSDESGNDATCTFSVDIEDITVPSLSCPTTQTISANGNCEYVLADWTGSVSVTDNCSATIDMIYSQTPVPSTILGIGTHLVTLNAEDESGNIGSCQFNVVVEDNTSPTVLSCASNQTVYADLSCEALVGDYTNVLTVSDNCSLPANISITQNPTPGTVISSSTSVSFTIEDEAGNTGNCSMTVIFVDTISPVVNCPVPQSIAINSNCEYSMPDLSSLVGGTDNCSVLGDMIISQNPIAGSIQNGITSVLIIITDEAGNNSICISTINPIDTAEPEITCPSPAPINNGALCDFTLPNYGTISLILDNCSDYSIAQNPPAGTVVQTGVTTITLVVTDAGGNSDECSFDLTVLENESPIINCPSDIVSCDPNIIYSDPTFSDNCAVSMAQTDLSGLSSGMIFPIGLTTLEYIAVDSSGNQQSCQFTVEVLDYPSIATIIPDSLFFCEQNGVVIESVPATSGTGEWTVLNGQGVFNNQFANLTGVNNIATGVNTYIWTISSASCGFTSDTLVVVNAQQDIQASTQDTLYACNAASIDLIANSPLFGTGTWSTSGSGTIANVNSSVTTSGFSNGWQDFIWTISNPGCPSTADTLAVFGLLQPEITTNDTLVCLENDEIELSANGQASGQGATWSVVSGSATISDFAANPTSAANFLYGITHIVYSVTHPMCLTQTDTVVISGTLCDEFEPVIPTVFTPGNLDGSNDVFTVDFLSIVYPECTVIIFNRWGSVVFESIGYDEPWDGTFKGEALPMGTYFYQIDLNDGSGKQLKGDISIIK